MADTTQPGADALDLDKLKALATDVKGWSNVAQVWRDSGDEVYIVGSISEDGVKYPVVVVDTQQYYEDSPALANFYAAANPAAVLALITLARRASQPVGGALVASDDKFDEIRALLTEAHQFASTSPVGKQNISAALDLLDEIESAAPAGALVANTSPVAGWARKRNDGSGYGNWLFQTQQGAESHGSLGDGYTAVALVEQTGSAAAPADLRETIVNAQADAIRGFVDAARETGVVTDPRFFVSAEKIIAKFRALATSQPIPTGEK